MKAVILAGGLGSRLAPFTQIIPKPLLPIGEKAVLELQILNLAQHGISDIFIATNYMADYVEAFLGDGSKYNVRLHFSREDKPLGTCGPITLLKGSLDDLFLLMNGDILTTFDFTAGAEFARRLNVDLTVVTKELVTPFHFGKVLGGGDYVEGVEEKPDIVFEILAGIYFLRPSVFEVIPHETAYGIDTLIKDLLARKRKIGKYRCTEYWLDIGQLHDYQTAQKVYDKHFKHLGDPALCDG
jgi:NDP-sugar pyrophosphorylase family protein